MPGYSVVGKRVPALDSVSKAAGQARFCGDLSLPGMLTGKILRSPYPHARLLHIDAGPALRLPGVRAVITGKETAGKTYGWGRASAPTNEPALAIDKARYIGDEVAAVAAIDDETAQEALGLIQVDYEQLPEVYDPEEAMKPGAGKIHDVENNVAAVIKIDGGDVEKGFKEADATFEDRYQTQPVTSCPLETHAALASFDVSGRITLWSSTQVPFYLRQELSITLDMPPGKIRVIKPYVGGGFGGKTDMLALDFCAALLSKRTGRPVMITHTREEELAAVRLRHPMVVYLRTGVKKDGTITAKQCKVIADGGAYDPRGPSILASGANQLTVPYRFPNFKYEAYQVYTNKPVCSAMRGYGNTQVRFADDCQMDRMAKEMGIDPLAIRLKNARESDERTCLGTIVTSCGLRECLQRVAESTRFKKKWGKSPLYRGIGLACSSYVSGSKVFLLHDASAAFVQIIEDGTVCLLTGAADVGQGANTTLAQLVAEEMGVSLEHITVVSGDTDVTPIDLGCYASRTTFMAGNAALAAARDAKKQVLEVAAEMLEANPADLELKDNRVYVKGTPQKGMPFREVVMAALHSPKGMPILGRGYYNPPGEFGGPRRSSAYSFSAQVAEVEINPETGQVKLLRLEAAQDCGLAINPMSVEGQIEGAISMGIGQALCEELFYDQGLTLNASLSEYRLPSALDMPEVKCHIVEATDFQGPFGAKGMSEGPQVPTSPAIANAIYDAIGIQIKSLPITPEKILEALERKGQH